MPIFSHASRAEKCHEHSECIAIISHTENERTREIDAEQGLPQGTTRVVQVSHMHESVDPAARLNPDYPDCDDKRPGKPDGAKLTFRMPDAREIASEHWAIDAGDVARLDAYVKERAKGLEPAAASEAAAAALARLQP